MCCLVPTLLFILSRTTSDKYYFVCLCSNGGEAQGETGIYDIHSKRKITAKQCNNVNVKLSQSNKLFKMINGLQSYIHTQIHTRTLIRLKVFYDSAKN